MEFTFSLKISYDAYLEYYKGHAQVVRVYDDNGQQLQINAKYFRPFLTPQGISGHFILTLDNNGRYKSLNKF